ncbi:uncharacterized protein LOC105425074 [Pogonomyrmex barbatus]|uniref:Uncharacterized protein LOC105425074 n=1 Tax=Pogonomyrmex barbatus TaxID=144034 RepID=A0A6I9W256_9HYME|nr:uncharacterized protein LOC105425074 [Pogonomyrmex barbatus]
MMNDVAALFLRHYFIADALRCCYIKRNVKNLLLMVRAILVTLFIRITAFGTYMIYLERRKHYLFVARKPSEMLQEKDGCNHRTPRGDGKVQGNVISEVNGSLSCLRPPLRPGPPSGGIIFFVILVTCISFLTYPP